MLDLSMTAMIFMFETLSEAFLGLSVSAFTDRSNQGLVASLLLRASLTPSTFYYQIFITKNLICLKSGTSSCLLNTRHHPFRLILVPQNLFHLNWQSNRWIFLRYQAIISDTNFHHLKSRNIEIEDGVTIPLDLKRDDSYQKMIITTIYRTGRISLLASGIFDDNIRQLKESQSTKKTQQSIRLSNNLWKRFKLVQ